MGIGSTLESEVICNNVHDYDNHDHGHDKCHHYDDDYRFGYVYDDYNDNDDNDDAKNYQVGIVVFTFVLIWFYSFSLLFNLSWCG